MARVAPRIVGGGGTLSALLLGRLLQSRAIDQDAENAAADHEIVRQFLIYSIF